jgi:MoaA/NifB/PqqE/SkfB family radical SAM enzyme
MDFPQFISFTVTNACNLRCKMCGQWSEEGYIKNKAKCPDPVTKMKLEDWKRLVDEAANYQIRFILVRGGEPFLFPGLIELLEYINSKGIFISLDTNGTMLEKYAEDLANIGNMHITFSIDGPEEIHDNVRGIKGSFKKTKENIVLMQKLDRDHRITKSICFTISKFSYKGLGAMPDVARSMNIESVNIVPYYYVPDEVGKQYEKELKDVFDSSAYSWKGFHHDDSGIDFEIFTKELAKYKANLNGIENFPYLPLTLEEYKSWFSDSTTLVGSSECKNVERLIDIQPDGEANFCVDYPDYSFGNARESTIKELWNSPKAEKFREYRRMKPLAVCNRCGGKYISEIRS